MLCEKCRQLGPAKHHEWDHSCLVRHHVDFKTLAESAQAGCQLCQLFSTRVEHRKKHPLLSEGPGNWDGWANEDPWYEPCQERYELAGTGGELIYYSDSSSHHYWLGTMNAGPLSLDLARRKIEEAEKENPVKKLERDDLRQWTCNHHFDHDEMFQWLFTPGQMTSGQEQIWITNRYEESGYKQREPIAFFDLTACSVDFRHGQNHCYQGRNVKDRQQLAPLLPELWKWRCQSLGRFEFYSDLNPPSPLDMHWPKVATKPISLHANSSNATDTLQYWFIDCKSNHDACQNTDLTVGKGPPKRLIDVRPLAGARTPRLHICGEPLESKDLEYAILSHCRDSDYHETDDILKLTSHNYESMKSGIDFDSLASNFRDAISITRALDLRYLWIDALCIMQDSPEEWESETAKIPGYFTQSELCIAATLSPNPQHGILYPRMIAGESVKLSSEAEDLGVRSIAGDVLSIIPLRGLMNPWPPARPPIANQPLNKACKTLQERLFSKRIVHFTEQQMVWQCQTCLIGEDGQIGEDRGKVSRNMVSLLGSPLRPRSQEIAGVNDSEHFRDPELDFILGESYSLDEALIDIRWYDILYEYTKLSISDPSKLLPYFSGVAEETRRRTGASYLAGLWSSDGELPFRSLIWQSLKRDVRANNGSPSWSWSSIIGPVTHPCLHMVRLDHPGARIDWVTTGEDTREREIKCDYTDSQIKIISSKVDLATSHSFGQVRGAELVISGLVHIYTGAHEYDYAAEGGADQLHKGVILAMTDYLDTQEGNDVDWKNEQHILVLVAEFRDNLYGISYGYRLSDQVRFIILRQISGSEYDLQRYVRVGTAKLVNKEDYGLGKICSAYTEANGWKRETLVLV